MTCAWLNLPKEKEKVKVRAQVKPICGRLHYCSADIHPLSVGGTYMFPCPTDVGAGHVTWEQM